MLKCVFINLNIISENNVTFTNHYHGFHNANFSKKNSDSQRIELQLICSVNCSFFRFHLITMFLLHKIYSY